MLITVMNIINTNKCKLRYIRLMYGNLVQINVYLTESEKGKLLKKAGMNLDSTSKYIRKLIVKDVITNED